MIRLVIETALVPRRPIRLTDDQNHYLYHVMRKKAGDLIEAVVPREGVFLATLNGRDLELGRPLPTIRPQGDIWLYQALLKQDRFADVVDKGTQIGISRFVPVMSERTVVRRIPANRAVRWRAVAREATEQSQRPDVPEIGSPLSLSALDLPEPALGVVLDPAGEPLSEFLQRVSPRPAVVAVAVGPEGGFLPNEVAVLARKRFAPVSLGPLILRAENAGMVAATLIRHAFFSFLG